MEGVEPVFDHDRDAGDPDAVVGGVRDAVRFKRFVDRVADIEAGLRHGVAIASEGLIEVSEGTVFNGTEDIFRAGDAGFHSALSGCLDFIGEDEVLGVFVHGVVVGRRSDVEQMPAVAEDTVVGPVRGPGTDRGDGDVVDKEHDRDKDGQAQPAVGDDLVDLIGRREFPDIFLYVAVGDEFADLRVTFVGDDGFRVVIFGGLDALDDGLDRFLRVFGKSHRREDLVVPLEQFDGIPAALRLRDVCQREGFDLRESRFDIGREDLRLRKHVRLCHFDGRFRGFHDGGAFQSGDLHDRSAQLFRELRDVDLVAVLFDDIHHIDGDDRRDAQLHDLCREVEVPLEVRAVDEVQDGIGMFTQQIVSGNDLFQRIRREGVDAGKVRDGDIFVVFEFAFFFLDRDSGPVTNVLVGAGERVEQGGLTAVRVAGKGNAHIH